MLETLFILIIFAIVAIAGFVVIHGLRTKGHIQRSLNLALFLISVPQEAEQKDEKKQEKEIISIGEQLLSSFAGLKAKGWNKLIYGNPYIALEIAVHHGEPETHFYIALPRSSEELLQKQIHSLYPNAEITRVKDYNIFNPEGAHAGAYIAYSGNPILPFRTYKDLEADPLNSILTSFSKLEDNEGAALQILLRPRQDEKLKKLAVKTSREMQLGYHFKKALYYAKHPPKDRDKESQKGGSIFNPKIAQMPQAVTPADENIIKAIVEKANSQTFDVNIRIATSAPNQVMAEKILNDIEASFTQFSSPDLNSLKIIKPRRRALNKLLYNFSFRLFNDRQRLFMGTAELNSIYHIPIESTSAPRVKFLKSRTAEPPPDLPREGVHIGDSIYRGQKIPVRLTTKDRRRHLYIIGQTGTGKSSLMKHMVEQDMEEGKGLCIIEPHGEFAEHALSVIPRNRAEDAVYFNPADIERPLGLNIFEFDPSHPEQKTLIINELLAIIDKLYNLKETGGPMFEKYFKNSCLLLMDDFQADPANESRIPVLADISRVLVDEEFRHDKLSRETNPLVRQFWELEAEKAQGEGSLSNIAPYISSKIDTFVSNDFLRPIINQKHSSIDFQDIMDSGKILVVSLSKGRIGEINANLLGMMIVTKLLASALARVDTPEEQRRDFYLYMDEFQNVTTDSIATILSEARKYRLNLTIAHQFIKQIHESIRDAVFGNVGSIAAFRIGPDDAEFMKNIFAPQFTPQDLINIDNFNMHVKILVNGKVAKPFNIHTVKEKEGDARMFENIKELSRLKYGRPREEVEDEIKRGFERRTAI